VSSLDVIAVDVVVETTQVFVDAVTGPLTGGGGGGGPTGTIAVFGSASPISPGTTAYIGIGWSIIESKAEFLVEIDGNVTDFGVSIGAQDLGPGSIVATLRRNGADAGLVATLSGVETSESVSGSVAFAKGDRATIKADVSVDVPAGVMITWSWRLVPT
jgi:hypothetical protein